MKIKYKLFIFILSFILFTFIFFNYLKVNKIKFIPYKINTINTINNSNSDNLINLEYEKEIRHNYFSYSLLKKYLSNLKLLQIKK